MQERDANRGCWKRVGRRLWYTSREGDNSTPARRHAVPREWLKDGDGRNQTKNVRIENERLTGSSHQHKLNGLRLVRQSLDYISARSVYDPLQFLCFREDRSSKSRVVQITWVLHA